MSAAEKLESPISEEFLNSFFDATQKVFQTQGNVKVQLVETTPFPMGMPNSSPTAIAGVIQISCNTFNGSLALGFPTDLPIFQFLDSINLTMAQIPEIRGEIGPSCLVILSLFQCR